jgi:hypothetical protein
LADKRKSIGNTLLGLFVVRPEDEAAEDAPAAAEPSGGAPASAPGKAGSGDATVDDLIARYAGGPGARAGSRPPPPPPARPGAAAGSRPPRAGAGPASAPEVAAPPAAGLPPGTKVPEVKVDFPAVLRRSGLTDDEQGRVDKTINLLHTLPAETPIEIRRQIVGASLSAFGISVDQIIESAALHLRAFDRHIKEGQKQTQTLLEQSTRRLAELEQEVARVKVVMQEQLGQQQGLTTTCNMQKLRVQEVLEFFGREALDRIAQTSVKLRDKLQEP